MSIIRYSIIILFFTFSSGFAEEVKKIGKFKDWEVIQVLDTSGKICFAQSKPVLQSPKKGDREARLFVTFRPTDKISDEVSTTSGYEYNSQNSIIASSGKSKYKFEYIDLGGGMGIKYIKDSKKLDYSKLSKNI